MKPLLFRNQPAYAAALEENNRLAEVKCINDETGDSYVNSASMRGRVADIWLMTGLHGQAPIIVHEILVDFTYSTTDYPLYAASGRYITTV